MTASEETFALLAAGRLSQRCPACGTREAAGYGCTACFRATGPADWIKSQLTEAKAAALAAARAGSRKSGPDRSALKKTANPGLVAMSPGTRRSGTGTPVRHATEGGSSR